MTDEYAALTQQLREDVGAVASALAALAGPADKTWDLVDRIGHLAPAWASQLLGDDDRLAAQTVVDLMPVLWPNGAIPTAWWSTPIGRAVARSVGHPYTDHVSYSVAGAMLGVTKQSVEKRVRKGTLDRHRDGGVTAASVRRALTE